MEKENKYRALIPYYGSKLRYNYSKGLINTGDIREYIFIMTETIDILNGTCTLILKPISDISDEDAIEVYKIITGKQVNVFTAKLLIENMYLEKEERMVFDGGMPVLYACQYLISKGYDLPMYLLNGKTLFECGLCIYE